MNSAKSSILDSFRSNTSISSSPMSISQYITTIEHLKLELQECRSKIKHKNTYIESIVNEINNLKEELHHIKKYAENAFIEIATLKVENKTLEDQIIQLKVSLERKYNTTLQKLEDCGIIQNVSQENIYTNNTLEKTQGFQDLNKLLLNLQKSTNK